MIFILLLVISVARIVAFAVFIILPLVKKESSQDTAFEEDDD